ncbi:hypothetical protein MHK_006674 [Candidatus Magnetomorum sp. HK-1]|nr:hypothetical protein MHK_006674 [Candidatus Magnetomorum sp. HK-1]
MKKQKKQKIRRRKTDTATFQKHLSIDSRIKGMILRFGSLEFVAKATNISEDRLRIIMKEQLWTEEESKAINNIYNQTFDFG